MNLPTLHLSPGGCVPCTSSINGSSARSRARAAIRFALFAGAWLVAQSAAAQTLYLLTPDGRLATTAAANPSANSAPVAITGVAAGETLVAIDVRPQNQKLYALGVDSSANTATLYHVAPETGVAASVSSATGAVAFTTDGTIVVALPDPALVDWDIDFNPLADRVRVVAGSLNFRIDPNTGAPVDGDNTGATFGTVTGTNPDGAINNGTTSVNATAYTNNRPNDTFTTQYTVDAATDSLFIQNTPASGNQTLGQSVTLGGNELDFSTASLDIAPGVDATISNSAVASGSAFLVATVGGTPGLYRLDLVTAQATLLGSISLAVRSAAIRTELGAAVVLDNATPALLRFDPASPGLPISVTITGIIAGEALAGIDSRPQTGQLYGLGINATAETGTLYLIDPQTGAATVVGSAASQIAFVDAQDVAVDFPDPLLVGYGFDFNPAVDRIRVIAASGLNFRLDPDAGTAVDGGPNLAGTNPDGTQSGLPGGVRGASGAAYTNSFGQLLAGTGTPGPTTLYTLDVSSSILSIQNPPNTGAQTQFVEVTLNGSILFFSGRGGFDIPAPVAVAASNAVAAGEGWFTANVGGSTGIYRLDLTTGKATAFGALGNGSTPLAGLVVWAVVPDLSLENPVGTVVANGASTVDFGAAAVGTSATATVKLRNVGTHPLNYSTTFDTAAFTATANGSGTIPGSSSVLVTATFAAAGAAGPRADTLHVLSNDPDAPSFEVALAATALATPEIDVEYPIGTVIQTGAGTVSFGGSVLGTPVTRMVKVKNLGEVALNFTTALATGAPFSVTQNPSGSVAGGGNTTLEITFTPTAASMAADTLQISSDDTSEPIFSLALTGEGLLAQTNDAPISTTGPTRFYPLANDPLGGTVTILAVSDPLIMIQGRALIIPAGYQGTFTYTVSNGTTGGRATVTVATGTAAAAPLSFNGVLIDANGKVAGSATATISAKGSGTAKFVIAAGKGSGKLVFPIGTPSVNVTTKLGTLTVTRNPAGSTGTVGVTLAATGGSLTGILHAEVTSAIVERHLIALASIDTAIPGGGYAVATVTKNGGVQIKGILPDGNAFSASTIRTAHGGAAFYAAEKAGAKPPGVIAGEFLLGALPATDVTGELVWSKPVQTQGGKGTHLGGVDTVLRANGGIYNGLNPLPAGSGTLKLSGGNLAVDESNGVTITAGVPPVPTGALAAWKASPKLGTFTATVTVPGVAKPVKASGVYLQKSNRAWGYFPGTTVGGRLELTVP